MLLPAWTALEIWSWISRLLRVRWSRALRVMTGRRAASGGKSHSWGTATSWSPHSRAKTISVALGSKEQILRLGGIVYGAPARRGKLAPALLDSLLAVVVLCFPHPRR